MLAKRAAENSERPATPPAHSSPLVAPHAETGGPRSGRFLGTSSRRLGQDFSETFGGYELVDELGRGGMGVVYKARQPGLDRFVALKVLLGGEMASKNQVKRFKREAEFAAKLKHPAIVQIHDVGQVGDYHYLTMDLVEGVALGDVIKETKLGDRRAAEILRDLADGLQHAHDQGVIHRDVKPANVMLTPSGQPVLTDFGLARSADLDGETSQLTRDGAMVGTPYYMSPEQASGRRERVVPKSDVFALGVMLYQLLTGKLPFEAQAQVELCNKILYEEPLPPRRHRPSLDLDLETIVLKALEKDPEQRYGAGELRDELQRWLAGDGIAARPLGVVERLSRRLERHRRLVLMGGAAAIVLELCAFGVARAAIDVEAERATHAAEQATARLREELEDLVRARAAAEAQRRQDAARAVASAERALLDAQRTPAGEAYRQALSQAEDLLGRALELPLNREDARLRVWRGRVRRSLHQHELAEEDLVRAAQLDPKGPLGAEASYLLARMRQDLQEPQRAREVLTAALKRLGDDHASPWRALMAAILALDTDPPDRVAAEAAVERARALDPRLAEVYLVEARLRRETDEADKLRQALLRAAELDPKSPEAYVGLARSLSGTDLDQAREHVRRALEIDPERIDALQLHSVLLQISGKFDQALPVLEKVLEQRPDDAEALFNLSQCYRVKEKRTEADQALRRLERAHPEDLRPYKIRALEELQERRFDRALEHLRAGLAATARAPSGAEAHRHLRELYAFYLLRTGSYDEARRWIAERLAADAEDGEALQLDAEVARAEQGEAGAIARLKELRAAHPRSPELWAYELQLLGVEGELRGKELRSRVDDLVAAFPRDPKVLSKACRLVAVVLEDVPGARALAKRLVELEPRGAEGPLLLAQCALLEDKPQEASRHLVVAARRDQDSAEAMQLLGTLMANLGKPREAMLYLQNAYAARPYEEQALQGLLLVLGNARPRDALQLSNSYLAFQDAAKRPPSPRILSLHCKVLLGAAQRDKARAEVERYLKAYPLNVELKIVAAELMIVLRLKPEAKALIDEVERLAPKHRLLPELRKLLD
ncbi:MAG: protein kinase [Planctomycetota bacterium]